MKYCPQCKRSYEDNTLNFCLDDGAVLISYSEQQEADTLKVSPDDIPTEQLSQPDLVNEFLETLDFQVKRRQWKGSRVGVNAFEFEVTLLRK